MSVPSTEQLKRKERTHPWGFPNPTVIIDSQSAPPLRGIEAEQQFYRMFLMGSGDDIAVTNYQIDGSYLTYLTQCLNIPVPQIHRIQNAMTGTLTGDIIAQPQICAEIAQLIPQGYKVQFFNFLEEEEALAQFLEGSEKVHTPTYAKNLEMYKRLGTKTGFREFCTQFGIPMPQGAVCHSIEEVMQVTHEIDGDAILKADTGTGGAELGSNATITHTAFQTDGIDSVTKAIQHLSPSDPPYDVQKKLKGMFEGSLHIFLNTNGELVIEPTVFGQFSHEGSYVGGHYPNHLPSGFNSKMTDLAKTKIIPALKKVGATGMHCMDCLFDPKTGEVYFIEDNTRPGALDFIHHFVQKVADTYDLDNPVWYHYQLPIKQIAGREVTFAEIQLVLSSGEQNLLTPLDDFVLLSNPNVLPYGYSLHLTAVSSGQDSSPEKAKKMYEKAMEKLIRHFGYAGEKIEIPEYEK